MSSGWRTHHIFMPRSTGGTILGERLLFNMLRVVSSGFCAVLDVSVCSKSGPF